MKRLYIVAFVALSGLGTYSAYRVYESHHLSSDLRITLAAASDQHITPNETRSYLYEARLQVQTGRDSEVLNKFETAFGLLMSGDALQNRAMQEMDDVNADISDAKAAHLGDDGQNIDAWKKAMHLRVQQVRDKNDRSRDEYVKAQDLFNSVRKDLGMPPNPLKFMPDDPSKAPHSSSKAL